MIYLCNMKKNNLYCKKLQALTLTELLIVMVIIGILVLLALPNLMPLVTKAKSTEAKIQLEHLYRLQQAYFMEHSKYSDDLQKVSFEQEKLVTEDENGRANYEITIEEASATSFRAKATAVVDFDGDGAFNVWSIDNENNLTEETPD